MKNILMIVLAGACVCFSASYSQAGDQPKLTKQCALVPEAGPCKGLFKKFYYNTKNNKCDTFFHGGCEGVVPFETMEECVAACENPAGLRISKIEPSVDLPFAILNVEYPKDGDEPKFTITVNGNKPAVAELGGGFDQNSREKSFLIALGENGKKKIVITAASGGKVLTAKKEYIWHADPVVELLGTPPGRVALFERKVMKLFTFGVHAVKVSLNGKPLKAKKQAMAAARGNLFKINPAWKSGKNTLTVVAKISNSNSITKEYNFYYMPDGKLAKGETVSLVYGAPGSKSGPFFSIETESKSIRLVDRGEVREYMINKDGWLWPDYKLIADLEGVEPGGAVLKIYQKPHFTMPRELDKEIKIKVVQ